MRFKEFETLNENITLGPKNASPGAPAIKDTVSVKPKSFRKDGSFVVDVPTGRTGTGVADVQKALIALGFPLPLHGVDGVRGPETEGAIKKFQQANGLKVDGIPGPETVSKLNDILKSKPGVAKKLAKSSDTELNKPKPVPGSDDKAAIKKVINAGAGFTDVETVSGEQLRRTGVRNWRNNNPGNLEFGPFARSKGAVGTDGRFAVFPTLDAGMKAKEDLVFGKYYINLSIRAAIAKYAPESENDVNMYVNRVVQATNASPDTILKDLKPNQRQAMLDTINKVEGFKPGTVVALAPTNTRIA